ncbi:hypothetical protein MAAFP003_1236 [Mycobacterium ahvazicum]|uniref:Uncharacterized protein n=1 Tax=Mycobacterium ahvazicum TaxID=1964395 RepID=A0A2K4Y704_9MYCO|nr:hypothetical protein [Mycobacterium ahvazicum]SOX52570.1 hypothetical protein MAAFP003_1236 [Mycobacterium ahvazicum]
MADQLTEDTLTALSLVTAAHGEKGRHKKLAGQIATDFANENPEDGHTRLVGGLINLCIAFIAEICLAKDITPEEALQDVAELVVEMGSEDE